MAPITIDRTVSMTPLPSSRNLLAVHYIRNPYGQAEDDVQSGALTGYYWEVLTPSRVSLSTLHGPYTSPTAAKVEGMGRHAACGPLRYTTVLSLGEDAVWHQLDCHERVGILPYDPTMRTARYLLLRDLVATMEAAGDDIAAAVAEALDDVAALKGVSPADETPEAPGNPLTDKDLSAE